MAKPSISMPDEFLAEFDALRDELKRQGDITNMDEDRAPAVRRAMRAWMDAKKEEYDLNDDFWVECPEGNAKVLATAD
jgi:metal-responsive CopG/Arc/MetJ family transcriptional regulator